jgi:hypothetical protein
MKYLALLLVLALSACGNQTVEVQKEQEPTVNADGCTVSTSSKLVTQHQVSPIFNLVKEKNENGSCKVKFDITVNGKTYHLEEYEERARENLLLDLGGEFQAESKIACRRTET